MTPPAQFAAEVVPGTPDRVCVVALSGRLDQYGSDILQQRLDQLYRAGERRFVLDLASVGYVGSIAIRVFLAVAGRVKGEGVAYLCAPQPLVKEVLDLVKIGTVIRCYPTRVDAVDAATTA